VREVLFALLAFLCACGRNPPEGRSGVPGGSSRGAADLAAEEQARFDAQRRPEKLIEALHVGPGSRVADVGAGSGLMTVHLARAVKPGGRVVATDIDGRVLDLLTARIQAAGLDDLVESRLVSPDAPGLEAGLYDAILLSEVDHYFTDEKGWLGRAIPALKPSGRIVISNRVQHRARSMAAAAGAGLEVESESMPVPSHFTAVLVPGRTGG
jgi:ubiquinone/menaquinone biosynthesis C-methylase UbiE